LSIQKPKSIALLPWGDVWEDFFSTVGIDFETFCNEVTGGWQFGFVEALKLSGFHTVLIYTSTRVQEPLRVIHKPTGATICLLPVTRSYRAIRNRMIHPYPSMGYFGSLQDLFGTLSMLKRIPYRCLRQIAPYLPFSLRLLARELKQHECSAIFCQEYEYSRFDLSVLLGRWLGLPVFGIFQGGTFDYNRIGRFLRPFTIRRCQGIIAGPQTERERLLKTYGLNPTKVADLFNPVDLRMWEHLDKIVARQKFQILPDAEVVVWHGRVHVEEKGLDILIEAWEQVCDSRPGRNLQLLLLGHAEQSDLLRTRIQESKAKNIRWIDQYIHDRDLMRHFLYTGDCYVFPSRYEGFPVSPLEAMACGLPVVASDASGMSDILPNGEESGGILVPREDAKKLAEAVGRVLDDHDLRRKLGSRARLRIEDAFSLETISIQLQRLLSRESPAAFRLATSLL
jgi:glycosyltransferase involved in cell wall biosynthesis